MASRPRRNWPDPEAERAWTRSYALQMAQQPQSANAPVHDQQQLTSPDGIHPAPSPLNNIPDQQTRPVVIPQASVSVAVAGDQLPHQEAGSSDQAMDTGTTTATANGHGNRSLNELVGYCCSDDKLVN